MKTECDSIMLKCENRLSVLETEVEELRRRCAIKENQVDGLRLWQARSSAISGVIATLVAWGVSWAMK